MAEQTFGRWLLAQDKRPDWISDLARSAKRDPAFPRDGDSDEVRARMQIMGADGDAFEALEDAERLWAA